MAISHNVIGGESLAEWSVMCQIYMGNGIEFTMKHAPDICQVLIQQSLQITCVDHVIKAAGHVISKLRQVVLKLKIILYEMWNSHCHIYIFIYIYTG